MPTYDFRCKQCGNEFALRYKSVKAYADDTPTCPQCQHTELARVIKRVTVTTGEQEYGDMTSDEMLNVLEGGNPREVGQMFKQIGKSASPDELTSEYHDVTDRLLSGESLDSVNKTIEENDKKLRSETSTTNDSTT